jgi:group I intron endonuclease
MKTYGYVYKITCKLNNKLYIGQTIRDIKKRWYGHCADSLKKNNNEKLKISRAIAKYGKENFEISVLCKADNQEELNNREKLCIRIFDSINSGYNVHEGGTDQKITLETRKKMSLAGKGKKKPKGFGEKIRQTRLGTKQPISVKIKCSTSQLGEKSAWFGRKHIPETKLKIGLGNKGKIVSKETGDKIRAKKMGTRASDETKAKMSIKRKGRKPNQRAILCISTGQIYPSILEASRQLKISTSYLGHHLKGKFESVKGLIFKYT